MNDDTPTTSNAAGGSVTDESPPADVAHIAAALDRLGAHERGGVPAGLADRVAMRSSAHLGRPAVIGRIGFGRAALLGAGLAAAAALAVWPAVLLLGSGPQGGGQAGDAELAAAETELETEYGAMVFVASIFDDESWAGDLETVGERTDALDAALDDPWGGLDTWAGESDAQGGA